MRFHVPDTMRFSWASLFVLGCAFVCQAVGFGSEGVTPYERSPLPSLMYDGDMPAHQDAGCRIPEIQNKGQYKLWSIDFRSGISMAVVTTSSSAFRPNSEEPEFLTVKDVAAIMNMSVKTVYDKAGKDEIPHYRFWGSVRFREDEF